MRWNWMRALKGRSGKIKTYFSPNGGCQEAVLEVLSAAQIEVLMFAYSFTARPILQGLVEAHNRKLRVELILDKSNNPSSVLPKLAPEIIELLPDIVKLEAIQRESMAKLATLAGLKVWIDLKHPIMHNKVMIIDKKIVVTGSYNWSNAAEQNAENLLIIRDRQVADEFCEQWEKHRLHSAIYNIG